MATSLQQRFRLVIAFSPLILGAVLPPGHAAAATEPCTVGGSTAAATDVERAKLACRTARARFGELFGDTVPDVHVVLHEDAGYQVASAGRMAIVFWPGSDALSADESRQGWVAAQWEEVLPHEVMHALTMARFYSDGGADGHGGYGTPLPDWFEEGIAIWGEPAHSREGRLRQARELPPARRDIAVILGSTHPVAGNAAMMAPVPGAPVPRDERLRAFYPQSIAALAFVHDVGGAGAVQELARRLVKAPDDPGALLSLPGLPGDAQELAEAWESWMQRLPSVR